MRILIIENEKYLTEAIECILKNEKYIVDISLDGESGLDNAMSDIYDAIILDVMLPKMDGFTILKTLRENNINTPVIMLTAKSEISDKVFGLNTGADDYLTKPFESSELVARINAIIRRKDKVITENLSFGDITLIKNDLIIKKENNSIQLTLKEYLLLEMLINNVGNLISKDIIIEKIWGYDTDAIDNNVEVYISFLRKKLKSLNSSVSIKTSRGLGYSLVK